MKSGLQSYKLGFVAMFALVLALVIVVFVQAGKTKQDSKTYNAATSIAGKLNTYVTNNGTVPASLAQAGATNVPSTIGYTRLSSTKYKFCVTYKTGSSGISGSDAISNSIESSVLNLNGLSNSSDNSSLTVDGSYHKGLNCQTVDTGSTGGILPGASGTTGGGVYQPQTNSKQSATNAGNQTSVCKQSGYSVHYSGTITNVQTLDGSTSDTSGAQSYIVTIQASGGSLKGTQSVTVTPSYNVFDSSCNADDGSILLTGDSVAVFQGSAKSPDTIQDLSF